MKFSQFNTFQPFQEKMLAYNAYTDCYMLLEHMLYDMIQSAMTNKNPEEINEVHPSFYEALVANGIIVDSDTDEIENVRLLMEDVNNEENIYRLIINPTMNCNFRCWYCYETHIKDSKMGNETVEKTCKFIKNVLENNDKLRLFVLSFFGGEPLLYYQKVVVPILRYANEVAREHGVEITGDFTTNGFLITEKMVKEFKELNVNNFQITLDGNKDHHNTVRYVSKERGSYTEIIGNIIMLAENHFNVTLRINYTKENLNKIEEILDDLSILSPESKQHVNISLHQVWQDNNRDLGPRVNEFMKLVRQLGFATTHSILGDSVRFSCYADKTNHATINYNGEVFKCTARDFTSANKEGVLNENGEIEWNEKYTSRLTSRLKNPPCLECAILPICGGGCSQKAMENINKEYCVNFFDENRKKNIVLDRFIAIAQDAIASEV
jgi:uncharacterized protein